MSQVAEYVLIPKAAEMIGYSRRAIELKIARGQWREGLEWRKAPDGHRMINLEGVKKWVEQGQA
jgi:hypothetical protein